MFYLLLTSVIWAFSFGLIKGTLTGLDSNLVSFIRMTLSFLFFLPMLNIRGINSLIAIKLIIIGMIQYGFMYITYIYSYQFLKSYEVALFTVFTPLYVSLINDVLNKSFRPVFLFTSILAVGGAIVIIYKDINMADLKMGFLLVQICNLCFASGQVLYKKLLIEHEDLNDHNIFVFMYFGAVLVTGTAALWTVDFESVVILKEQWHALLYLGVVASGICFFMWNFGAKSVNMGLLAVFNNLKIPLAMICSFLVFGERENNIVRLCIGGGIIVSALFLNEVMIKRKKKMLL